MIVSPVHELDAFGLEGFDVQFMLLNNRGLGMLLPGGNAINLFTSTGHGTVAEPKPEPKSEPERIPYCFANADAHTDADPDATGNSDEDEHATEPIPGNLNRNSVRDRSGHRHGRRDNHAAVTAITGRDSHAIKAPLRRHKRGGGCRSATPSLCGSGW